jgi:hypothetical protein
MAGSLLEVGSSRLLDTCPERACGKGVYDDVEQVPVFCAMCTGKLILWVILMKSAAFRMAIRRLSG